MITVIHGDNELQVRKEANAIRQAAQATDVVTLQKPDALTLRQNLNTGMFFDTKTVIVDGMLEKGVSQEVIDFLATAPTETHCVFVEGKRLDRLAEGSAKKKTKDVVKGKSLLAALQKSVKGIRVIGCNDYTIFDFLDALVPGNTKKIMSLYDQLMTGSYEPEAVFYMMIDHLRNLIIAKDVGSEGIIGMHDFRKTKLLNQARQFGQPQLITIYKKLFELEVAQKQKRIGEGSPFSMEEDLHFFLAQAFSR